MSFTPIETQEAFEEAIKSRLERERQSIKEQFSDYDEIKNANASYKSQIEKLTNDLSSSDERYTTLDTQYKEVVAKNARYESDSVKTRIALGAGLPYEMVDRVKGTSEEEIKADVESLMGFINKPVQTQPLFTSSDSGSNSEEAIYKTLVSNLSKEK